MRFVITFKQGQRVVATVEGNYATEAQSQTVENLYNQIVATERFLEVLTGYRCHIELAR